MRIKILLIGALFCFVATGAQAQEDISVSEVTAINLGDGRLLFRSASDQTPINGEHRIISGYSTEYILAQFKDGLYDGSYKRYRNNKLTEEGTYKGGVRDGIQKEYNSDGASVNSEKHFKSGKPDGIWKTFYVDGKPESEKGYKDGVESGCDRRWNYQTGKLTRDCLYLDGKMHGPQTINITGGGGGYVERSNYKNGVKEGDYSETWDNGVVRAQGKYKAGKREGRWIENKKDGKPSKDELYKNGARNGECKTFFSDGSVEKIENYLNDARSGVSKEFYYQSGSLKNEYTYADNAKDGPYKLYYDDGTLREEGRCEKGSEVYQKTYYKDGKVREIRERTSKGWETIESYDSNGKQR